jgi:hypothetical protein
MLGEFVGGGGAEAGGAARDAAGAGWREAWFARRRLRKTQERATHTHTHTEERERESRKRERAMVWSVRARSHLLGGETSARSLRERLHDFASFLVGFVREGLQLGERLARRLGRVVRIRFTAWGNDV